MPQSFLIPFFHCIDVGLWVIKVRVPHLRKRLEMNATIHVQARAVIIKNAHILLCKTVGLDHNFYFLPGGHVEHYEGAKQAMERELLEEIGFNFEITRFLGCLEYSYDPKIRIHAKCHTHEYNLIFEATSDQLMDPTVPLEQLEKHIETVWVRTDQLAQIDLRPELLAELIPQWLETNYNGAFQSLMTA
jgi:8-oxo-dGTP diphosphatase